MTGRQTLFGVELDPLTMDETVERCLEAVRDGGKAASLIPGPPPEAPRGIQFHQFNGIPNGARLALLAQLIDAGSLRVIVQEVVPLARARDAHKMLEDHAVRGKVVLRVDE